jgi:hypothetical protein
MLLEKVSGYFTIERHLVGADVREITKKLGFPPNYLLHGARVLVIVEKIEVGDFLFAGSTWYPDEDGNPKGLVSRDQRRNFPIPGAWLGERLVKIKPIVRLKPAPFPRAGSPVEQWQLLVEKQAREVDRLLGTRKYSPR